MINGFAQFKLLGKYKFRKKNQFETFISTVYYNKNTNRFILYSLVIFTNLNKISIVKFFKSNK